MNNSYALGRIAEDRAAEYIRSIGMDVIDRNVRNDYGELDITAFDVTAHPKELVIIEVRCRTLGKMQSPLESIGSRKIRTLMRASQQYVDDMNWPGFWRIDAVGITADKKKAPDEWELEHVRDITA